jgi:hypothetical protein
MTDRTPTKLAQEVTFLVCVLDVSNSIFGRHTDYPEVLRGLLQSSFKNQLLLLVGTRRLLSYPSKSHSANYFTSERYIIGASRAALYKY